jgi:hypothetical protein
MGLSIQDCGRRINRRPALTTTARSYSETSVEPARLTEADVERLAALAGVPIAPADLPAVAVALGVLLGAARLVSEFPLPDDVEPAPVFRP